MTPLKNQKILLLKASEKSISLNLSELAATDYGFILLVLCQRI
jgi:hypothetical protein